MAFGVGVQADRLEDLRLKLHEKYKHIDFGSDYIEVDYIFEKGEINQYMLKDFAEHIEIYGNGIAQPKFAFKILVSKNNFNFIGANKDTVKLTYKGVTFIKFKDSELAKEIQNADELIEVELIDRSQINEFRGYKNLQVIIDNIKFNKNDIKRLF